MKKYLTVGNILLCLAAVLGLVSVLLMFAPSITSTVEILSVKSTSSFSGARVTFGYTETPENTKLSIQIFKFSFGNFLPYLLALVGIVFAVLAIFGKLGKISGFVAAGCFLIAGILFFCALAFTVPAAKDADMKGYTLGAGAIVSGILSLISAALCVVPVFLKK